MAYISGSSPCKKTLQLLIGSAIIRFYRVHYQHTKYPQIAKQGEKSNEPFQSPNFISYKHSTLALALITVRAINPPKCDRRSKRGHSTTSPNPNKHDLPMTAQPVEFAIKAAALSQRLQEKKERSSTQIASFWIRYDSIIGSSWKQRSSIALLTDFYISLISAPKEITP